MVVPHSGGYPHAKFEGNLLLFKFEPHTKSGLTIPQCVRTSGRYPEELSIVDIARVLTLCYRLVRGFDRKKRSVLLGPFT